MSTSWLLAALVCLGANEPAGTKPATPPDDVSRPIVKIVELREMTLAEAIKIGLVNSQVIRVVPSPTGRVVIARLNTDAAVWNFKAAIMAHVRSVEQQYWAIWQQAATLKAREAAVAACQDVGNVEKKKQETGTGNANALADAIRGLEKAQLAMTSATSDAITIERQFRNILGLPMADNRRIIATSTPISAKVEPNWETNLATMMANQPDIVTHRDLVAKAERQDEAIRSLKSVFDAPVPDALATLVDQAGQQSQVALTHEKALMQQVVHQTTHTLARFFLEVDAQYKQYVTAGRLREATATRLEAAKAYYKEGKPGFSVDRLIETINAHADAVAQQAQFLATYNVCFAAIAEARGNLLDDRQITVSTPSAKPAETFIVNDQPRTLAPDVVSSTIVDPALSRASFTPSADTQPLPPVATPIPSAPAPKSSTTIKYQFSIDKAGKTTRFEGTITTEPKP